MFHHYPDCLPEFLALLLLPSPWWISGKLSIVLLNYWSFWVSLIFSWVFLVSAHLFHPLPNLPYVIFSGDVSCAGNLFQFLWSTSAPGNLCNFESHDAHAHGVHGFLANIAPSSPYDGSPKIKIVISFIFFSKNNNAFFVSALSANFLIKAPAT